MVVAAFEDEKYKPPVDVSGLYSFQDTWEGSVCPLIGMKNYLQTLTDYVAKQQPVYSLVVVGPTSSGKSEGIQRMKVEWKRLGYTVLDINLKGKPYNLLASQVLGWVSKEIHEVIEGGNFDCLSEYIYKNCSIVKPNHSGYIDWLKELFRAPCIYISVSTAVVIYFCFWYKLMFFTNDDTSSTTTTSESTSTVTTSKSTTRDILIKISLLPIVGIVVEAIVFTAFLRTTTIEPLNTAISSGNWKTLCCTCNGIAMCMPEQQPILIIRDFDNFHEESLNGLLRSLESMKEKQIMFPVILETSNFFWLNKKPVVKSSMSFQWYFLNEMSFFEGVDHVVNQYKMWKFHEFVKIYDALGGHTGSYAELWDEVKSLHTVDEAIDMLRDRAYSDLLSCTIHVRSKELLDGIKLFLCELQKKRYKMKVEDVLENPPCSYLISCNILFAKNDLVYPQNRLLEHGINVYLKDFANNCQ